MLNKIKNISKKSLLVALGLIIGLGISWTFASGGLNWSNPSSFLQTAIDENRVLKPGEIQKIKDDLEILKNQCFSSDSCYALNSPVVYFSGRNKDSTEYVEHKSSNLKLTKQSNGYYMTDDGWYLSKHKTFWETDITKFGTWNEARRLYWDSHMDSSKIKMQHFNSQCTSSGNGMPGRPYWHLINFYDSWAAVDSSYGRGIPGVKSDWTWTVTEAPQDDNGNGYGFYMKKFKTSGYWAPVSNGYAIWYEENYWRCVR